MNSKLVWYFRFLAATFVVVAITRAVQGYWGWAALDLILAGLWYLLSSHERENNLLRHINEETGGYK